MTEITTAKKEDVIVYCNDEILGGVFDINVKSTGETQYLYEMLNAEPWAQISKKYEYIITIKQYSKNIADLGSSYSISLYSDDKTVKFTDCSTQSTQTYTDSSGCFITQTVISAGGRE